MRAVLYAPETAEGDALARVLSAGGYEVERLAGDGLPSRRPDVAVLLHAGGETWTMLRDIAAATAGAPVLYVGSRPTEALDEIPEVEYALPRPVKSVELRVEIERLGLPWGPQPAAVEAAI